MKYEHTVMIEKGLNGPPEFEVQERLKEEFSDWEVVSAKTETGSVFRGTDGFNHVHFTTTVVLRRPALTAEYKA